VNGSAYRRPGAKLLVAEDGTTTGNVSGGCLEQDVREVPLQVIRAGQAEVRRYCSSSDEIAAWDLGVGCDGQVDVLIAPAPEPLSGERAQLDGRMPFAVATLLPTPGADRPPPATGRRLLVTPSRTEGTLGAELLDAEAAVRARELAATGRSAVEDLSGSAVFIDTLTPPPQLVLFGAGDDARPLTRFAADIGFRVVVTDRRPAYLTAGRFPAAAALVDGHSNAFERHLGLDPSCYAVVMTHSFSDDLAFVRLLLRSPVALHRHARPAAAHPSGFWATLAARAGSDESQRSRIYGRWVWISGRKARLRWR
jgi:xanthine/CO dehydrogenase XdhC/CoxF family maturation factor